ncbi:MAG: UvrD-helicase domain-containing protein, partial [Oscillospiraceae bacterium]|nr:UvrD-helicase domain-containing protein [Oscillospiraceae bacterium]
MNRREEIITLRKAALEREFARMNDMQRKAVFQTEGPLLILAGAGSGKTTVLVNRIANLIRNGNSYHSDALYCPAAAYDEVLGQLHRFVEDGTPLSPETVQMLSVDACRPWQILAITFTNKAAGELKSRLCAMLGDDGNDIWASTFHATCARMLRRDGDKLGFTNHFTIYDTDDSRRLMKDCLKTLNINEKNLPVKSVLGEISRAKDRMESPADFASRAGSDYRLGLIAKAYKLFQSRLKEADAMDFDDLIYFGVQLLQSQPEVLEYYQNKFRYIMVDEYQDTNHAQYLLTRLLSQKHGNLCVVGDDDQSIYKFRGATIENIMSFEQTFPNANVIRLEQNYRSTQTILDAANAVIANNEARKGKNLWTQNGKGAKISVHTATNELDEADTIAKQILDNVSKGRRYGDHAILYRMNSQSNSLERVFVKSGIRYKIIGGLRFYERKEIRDMIAYLSVINNPTDEIRLRRIINQPKRAIGDRTVAVASEIAQTIGESLFYVIDHADEFEPLKRSAGKLRAFAAMMKELMAANEDPETSLEELYQLLLEKTDYIAFVQSDSEMSQTAEDRIDNINELASNLIQYETDYGEEASLS